MKQCQCGQPISGNKDRCAACQGRHLIEARPLADLNVGPATTHLVIQFESKNADELYRADGMLIAVRQQDAVHYGDVIQMHETRRFLTWDAAKAFLHRLAEIDLIASAYGRSEDFKVFVWNYRLDGKPFRLGDQPVPAEIPKPVMQYFSGDSTLSLPGGHSGVDFKNLLKPV